MRIFFFIISYIFFTSIIVAQKPTWYDTYWAGAQVNLIYGTENTLGFSANVGKNINKNIAVGIGYSGNTFNTDVKLSTIELIGELAKKEKGRQLFLQLKPGINIIRNGDKFGNTSSRFEFEKNKVGFNLYTGAGMRWFVGRHAFSICVGMMDTRYSFTSLEYPIVIDPYNPFVENPLNHTYKYKHQKVVISLGFRF